MLKRLQEKGLNLGASKCEFQKTELEYFGIKFSKDGIAITEEKIKALKESELAKTQSELRNFLRLANNWSRSIPNLAIISNL